MSGFGSASALFKELARQTQKLSWTGDTSEKVLLTVDVPPMGENSYLELSSLWSVTNNANNKIVRVRLGGIGGSVLMQWTATTIATVIDINRKTLNRGATNSQISSNALSFVGTSTGNPLTTSIETNAGTTLVFTVQLANAADTASLEYAVVNLVL